MGCVGSSEDGVGAESYAPVVSSTYVETRKGYPETLMAEEREVMAALRAQLAAEGVKGSRWEDDHEICRWLRARKFDIPATKLMIANHLQWEKEYDVDHVYRTFQHRDLAAVMAAYPRTYHRTDRIGRPINIDRVGRLDIKRINELTSNDEMEKEKIQDMVRTAGPGAAGARTAHAPPSHPRLPARAQERTLRVRYPACSKAAGRTINQSLVIMDLSGMSASIWNGQTRAMLKRLTGVLSDHYPETMGLLFIVNAPSFFAAIWSVVRLFLDPGTVQKISILSSGSTQELFRHVDPASLPPFLGGTDETFDLMHEQGPWVAGSKAANAAAGAEDGPPAQPRRRRWLACCCA